jgi:hypothetical protein
MTEDFMTTNVKTTATAGAQCSSFKHAEYNKVTNRKWPAKWSQ